MAVNTPDKIIAVIVYIAGVNASVKSVSMLLVRPKCFLPRDMQADWHVQIHRVRLLFFRNSLKSDALSDGKKFLKSIFKRSDHSGISLRILVRPGRWVMADMRRS